jgi:photosystem II stability/assembly factor-like uncharacterized protein
VTGPVPSAIGRLFLAPRAMGKPRSAASLTLSFLILTSCVSTSAPTVGYRLPLPSASPSYPSMTSPSPRTARATTQPPPTVFAPPSTAPTLPPPPPETPTPSPVETPSASPTSTPKPGHLVVDAQLVGPGIGWIETDQALLVTDDDGQTWRDATPAGQGATYGLAALDGQTAFVATDEVGATITTVRIWRTSDGGRTWHGTKLASVPSPDTYADCGCGGHGVLVDIVDALDVFVDVVTVSGTDGEGHDVFRSLDGGLTWKSMVLAIEQHGAPADLAIHFQTATIGTVLFDERLFVTDSGWGQWTEVDPGGHFPAPEPVTFLDGRRWITAGRLRYVDGTVPFAESVDAGRTWTVATRTVPVTPGEGLGTAFEFIDSRTWVASLATRGLVQTWISHDAGKSWVFVGNQPSSDPRRSTFVDAFNAWVIDDAGGLAATSDGGANWSPIGP